MLFLGIFNIFLGPSAFFWVFLIYFFMNHFRENLSKNFFLNLRKNIIIMNVRRKCRFYRSLFGNFLRADDHWEVILDLKSAPSCRCISK